MQTNSFWNSNEIKLLAGVVAISVSPLAVKLVTFTAAASAFYRSFYAALFFFIFSLFRSQKSCTNSKNWQIPSIIAGLFLGIDLIVWHKTIIYLGAGPATFLGNSQIIFVTLFAALVFKEKIPLMYYVTVAVVMAGLFMLTPSSSGIVSRPYGFFLGVIVGFTYAGMLIALRYAKTLSGKDYPEISSLAWVFGVSSLTIALYSFMFEPGCIANADYRSHAIMAATALFCQTVGWHLINNNIVKIPAHEGSLMLMMQPLLATVWGALLFSERIDLVQGIGMVLTVAAIALYQTKFAQKKIAPSAFEE